jgi:hypothetical protein
LIRSNNEGCAVGVGSRTGGEVGAGSLTGSSA